MTEVLKPKLGGQGTVTPPPEVPVADAKPESTPQTEEAPTVKAG